MPRLLDLYCGLGGWTKGFQAEGWDCVGIDLLPQPNYPGEFVRADILRMGSTPDGTFYISEREDGGQILWECKPDFVAASSPCEEFSVHCMKHFHPNPKHPATGILLFDHTRTMLDQCGIPYIMENVRCAERFIGKAVNHCGPFYLWGPAVPAVMPSHLYSVRKGIDVGLSAVVKGMSAEEKRNYRSQFSWNNSGSKSKARKEATARAAEIPLDLARYVARAAANCVGVTA